jgi:hypothetical protein
VLWHEVIWQRGRVLEVPLPELGRRLARVMRGSEWNICIKRGIVIVGLQEVDDSVRKELT